MHELCVCVCVCVCVWLVCDAVAVLSGWQGLVLLLPAILATPPYTAVLADARPATLLALVSLAAVLADARALLHCLH